MHRRLYRSVRERVLGGVAGGVAEYFDLDPALVRVAWAILILATGGAFLLLYIVMWIVVPEGSPYGPGPAWGPPPPVPPVPGAASEGEPGADQPASASPPAGETGPAGAAAGAPTGPPQDEWSARHWERWERRRRRSGSGALVLGSIFILVGAWFLAREYFSWLQLPDLWPLLIIALGLVLLVGSMRPRSD